MEYATTTEVKKALKKEFPGATISVRKGRGTACGWIYATLSNAEMYSNFGERTEKVANSLNLPTYIDDMNMYHSQILIQKI